MKNSEFFQRKRFKLTCPFMENCLICLFIFTIVLTHLNLIDVTSIEQTRMFTFQNHTQSRTIPHYFALLHHSLSAEVRVSVCLAGLTHLPV